MDSIGRIALANEIYYAMIIAIKIIAERALIAMKK